MQTYGQKLVSLACAFALLGSLAYAEPEQEESENPQNTEESKPKSAQERTQKKLKEAQEETKKIAQTNLSDWKVKNKSFGGIGIGYQSGDATLVSSYTNGIASASGNVFYFKAGYESFFTKMHGYRAYLDLDFGFGGGNSLSASDLYLSMMFSLDYRNDFLNIGGFNLGAFAGVSAGYGFIMPYTTYYDPDSFNYVNGWTTNEAFGGLGYGFQAGLLAYQSTSAHPFGLEVGFKYRSVGGSFTGNSYGSICSGFKTTADLVHLYVTLNKKF
ncbi:hypothetical protein [uncultured Helicobacter sp.]|uniref:hypothetical protein n=1 Tax=uncultured Helicobacter sp. TaxID=175537 RepID=UPI00374FAC2D